MKKVINGKMYDTATAELVGSWDNGRYGRDFGRCSEDLYRKRTGEFFLHGDGGPMTKYAVSCGDNEWSGSSKIIPLTYKAAQEWAEEHLDGEEYEAIFGEIVEDDSRVNQTISLSATVVELARRRAAQQGVNLSSYIESLIKES